MAAHLTLIRKPPAGAFAAAASNRRGTPAAVGLARARRRGGAGRRKTRRPKVAAAIARSLRFGRLRRQEAASLQFSNAVRLRPLPRAADCRALFIFCRKGKRGLQRNVPFLICLLYASTQLEEYVICCFGRSLHFVINLCLVTRSFPQSQVHLHSVSPFCQSDVHFLRHTKSQKSIILARKCLIAYSLHLETHNQTWINDENTFDNLHLTIWDESNEHNMSCDFNIAPHQTIFYDWLINAFISRFSIHSCTNYFLFYLCLFLLISLKWA